jgi:hypothetical protein
MAKRGPPDLVRIWTEWKSERRLVVQTEHGKREGDGFKLDAPRASTWIKN